MTDGLMSLFQAAGLAGASGHRAFIPALALGAAHHLGLNGFELNQHFTWLADPAVMAVLGGLTVVELLAEMNPDAPEIVNLAMKLPKMVSGFVVVAASVGTVNDSMTLMAASGVLGAGTALTVDSLRAQAKHAVHDHVGEASDGLSTKVMGGAESIWSGVLAVLSVVLPVVAAAGLLLIAGLWWGGRRTAQATAEAKYVPCPSCKEPRHPEATACPHCRSAIPAAS
mgnify:CR=1 FL=1